MNAIRPIQQASWLALAIGVGWLNTECVSDEMMMCRTCSLDLIVQLNLSVNKAYPLSTANDRSSYHCDLWANSVDLVDQTHQIVRHSDHRDIWYNQIVSAS